MPKGMNWTYTKPAIAIGILTGILLIIIMVPCLFNFINRKEPGLAVVSIAEIGIGIMSIVVSIRRGLKVRNYNKELSH